MVNICDICGELRPMERHHLFAGIGRRRKSELYGAVIHVCHNCHMAIRERPKAYEYLKRNAQIVIMTQQGWDTEDFIQEFGKSYI